MKQFIAILLLCLQLLVGGTGADPQYPLHDDGLNKIVQWDHYSLMVKGERLVVWAGEFHYWRIPVPELWLDLMEKIKAAGWNTVAIYASWAWHNPAPGVLNFEDGAHNLELLFEYAKQTGLYILWRPGPYINAEANAGGFPGWVTTGAYGTLRNNDTRYHDAWYPYFAEISKITSKHLVTKGGPVILVQMENEIGSQWIDPIAKTPYWPSNKYMEQLEQCARENGMDIPTITNAPNRNGRSWSKDYSTMESNQDIYGLDSYPQCWSCDESECTRWAPLTPFIVQNYRDHFTLMSPTQPSFLPEFQGGAYNPWGGVPGGCRNSSGPDFVNVFYRDNLAQRVTMHSVYMTYGGTNWGGMAWDGVGTSYDYSAPIQEDRIIADKFHESRLLGLQVRVAQGLTKTTMLGNSTSYATNPYIFATELQNIDDKSRFYFIRHQPSDRTATDTYKLSISTTEGKFSIPQSFSGLQLNGRDSKIIQTDYDLTGGRKIVYSTAEILSFTTTNRRAPLLVLWVSSDSTNEVLIQGTKGRASVPVGKVDQKAQKIGKHSGVLLTFIQKKSSTSVVQFEDGLRVLIVDRAAAYALYAPSLSSSPLTPKDQTVIVTGPHLVRTVSQRGSTIALTGDLTGDTSLEVFGSGSAEDLSWNGQRVRARRTSYGSLTAKITSRIPAVKVPALSSWKAIDNFPERSPTYDDSLWTKADKTSPNPTKPGTAVSLWAEDYNIFWGPIIWRGRFSTAAVNPATGIWIGVNGGQASSYSVYLNGENIGNWQGYRYASTYDMTLSFANATLYPASSGKQNVLTVLQDMTGKGLRDDALIPRGITNATFINYATNTTTNSTSWASWKVAGPAGNGDHAQNFELDPIRGPLAEGAWHHERLGWHLPGFRPTKDWEAYTAQTLKVPSYGAKYFLTTFPLSVPSGVDAVLAFHITDPGTTKDFRVWLYVNGYQFGRMYSRIGPQTEFPVPPGILNYNGDNTLGVVVWAQDKGGAETKVELKVTQVVESSFNVRNIGRDLRPGYKDRSAYY